MATLKADAKKYPELYRVVKRLLKKIPASGRPALGLPGATLFEALVKHCRAGEKERKGVTEKERNEAMEKKLRDALGAGDLPNIVVVDLPLKYSYNLDNNIQLNKVLIDQYESFVEKIPLALDDLTQEVGSQSPKFQTCKAKCGEVQAELGKAVGGQLAVLDILLGAYLLIESKILHEMVHWAYATSPPHTLDQRQPDEGWRFEKAAYDEYVTATRLGIHSLIGVPRLE